MAENMRSCVTRAIRSLMRERAGIDSLSHNCEMNIHIPGNYPKTTHLQVDIHVDIN